MNENPQNQGASLGAATSVAIGLVIGAVVGAGIALLLAPGSGRETRRRLAEAGGRLGDTARSKVDEARDVVGDLQKDAKAALEAGRGAFDQARNSQEKEQHHAK